MRKLILLLMAVVSLTAMSQQLKRVYFFDGFAKGHVMYKNGSKYNVKLNYDANNQVMLFMQGDVMMEMTNPQHIDTVFVAGRKLVYHDNRFCEVEHLSQGRQVLIGWLIKDVYGGRTGAFGLPTQAQVIKLRAVDLIGPEHGHNMNAGMEISQYDAKSADLEVWKQKNDNTYYFVKDGVEYGVRTIKDVYKSFPAQKAQIKAYVKENKLDMMHTDKALRIVDYLLNI